MKIKRIPIKKLHLELSTTRIEALTDGVFAIAMTILVLGFEVAPEEGFGSEKLIHSLKGLWPLFHDYLVSFFILATFWINHHRQFHFIKRSDATLLRVNILSLLFICLIPFTTTLQGNYGHLLPADLIFEFNMLCAGLCYHFQWRWVTKNHRLVDKDLDADVILAYKYRTMLLPILSMIAMLVSLVNPELGTSVYLLVPFMFLFFKRS